MITYHTTAPAWLGQVQSSSSASTSGVSGFADAHYTETRTMSSSYKRGSTYDGARFTYTTSATGETSRSNIDSDGNFFTLHATEFGTHSYVFDGTLHYSSSSYTYGESTGDNGTSSSYGLGGVGTSTTASATISRTYVAGTQQTTATGKSVETVVTYTIDIASTTTYSDLDASVIVTTTMSGYWEDPFFTTSESASTTITVITYSYDSLATYLRSTISTSTFSDEAGNRLATLLVYEINHASEMMIAGLTATPSVATFAPMTVLGATSTRRTLTAESLTAIAVQVGSSTLTQTITTTAAATATATTTAVSLATYPVALSVTGKLPAKISGTDSGNFFLTTTDTVTRLLSTSTTSSLTASYSLPGSIVYTVTWQSLSVVSMLGVTPDGSATLLFTHHDVATATMACTSTQNDSTFYAGSASTYSVSSTVVVGGSLNGFSVYATHESFSRRDHTTTVGIVPFMSAVGASSATAFSVVPRTAIAAPNLGSSAYSTLGNAGGETIPYPWWSSVTSNVSAAVFFSVSTSAYAYAAASSRYASFTYAFESSASLLRVTQVWTIGTSASSSTHEVAVAGVTAPLSYAMLTSGFSPDFHGVPAISVLHGWVSVSPGAYLYTYYDSTGGSTSGSSNLENGTTVHLSDGRALALDTQIPARVLASSTHTAMQGLSASIAAYAWTAPSSINPLSW